LPLGKSLSSLGSDCDDTNSLLYQSTTLYADSDADGFGTTTATLVCAPVNCVSSSAIAVTFRVNMSAETVESGGVHVAGNFATRGSTSLPTDWSPSAAGSQLKSIGNNVYELTVLFPASAAGQQLQYKFLRNNAWNSGATQYSEQNISSACGTNDGGGKFNRSLVLPSQYALIETVYDQCPSSSVNYLCNNTDCNDSNASLHASYEFYVDADHDNYGAGSAVMVCAINAVSPPIGYSVNATDCDDNNILVYRTGDFYVDADGDGFTVGAAVAMCYGASVPAGYSATSLGEDCNDNNATIFQSGLFYVDADNDTYTVGSAVEVCYGLDTPSGYATVASLTDDCNDNNPAIYQLTSYYIDADGDNFSVGVETVCSGASAPAGYSATTSGADCDDTNASITFAATFYEDADGDGYGNAAVTTSVCSMPSGYVTNSTDCDDTNMSIYQLATFYVDADGDGWDNGTASVCSGTSAPAGYSATTNGTDCDDTNAALTNNCGVGSVVNLNLFIQGYYLGGGLMNSVKMNQDFVSPDTDVEDMTIELHDATTYALVETTVATLHTDGTLSATFTTAAAGDYYIAVKGANVIQTWSAAPVTIGTTPASYDFTSAASQAYGDNMIEIDPGVFAMYSGELAADDFIDTTDYVVWESDYNNFAFGVFASDLNGDGFVDGTDYVIWEGNYNNFIFAFYPF
jgi:hypothetical protein